MINQAIKRLDDRDDAFVAALTSALGARVIKEEHKHYTDWSDADIAAGVVMVLGGGEGKYKSGPGMAAQDGTQEFILIGHLKVDENNTQKDLKHAEYDLMEEIKSFVKTGVTGTGLYLERLEQSRQLEHPYGWVVAYINAGPPNETTY